MVLYNIRTEVLVYRAYRQESPRLGREPFYLSSRMLKITSFLFEILSE
ncbi:hypothetical protein [Elizabethkingia anophelis]|nr:hypothetical protein [Elizabethkingia anophelis]EHM7981729.1 hypothetical protein [Elizabethkingia anophelis]EHM8032227.1 hypothetical protein [Elizabethkingia anophelis]EHZ9535181.1 hypothetical protein [Elizabethkingia anophelis]EKU3673091.1 hypothetical protein [Elizabethkingia anophelis]EKU4210068.1 hypothetical protein [Elizabethkingia anophelis]